ncbi:MAG: hypothetical protein WCX28_03985 [Bacteriovoracaceae bacterium]|nr:hypothetical protein [Bacteroidota bacterium]
MKPIRIIPLLLITALLSGCPARSLHPLFSERQAVLLASLIGTWENNEETYTFEPLQGNNYRLVIRPKDEKDSSVYSVLSGKIGSDWFLDSFPIVNSKEHHYLSMHVITKMTLNGDTLTLAMLESDWLLKAITEKKITVQHVKRENEIILTGSTEELRRFITLSGSEEEAFPDVSVFIRSH